MENLAMRQPMHAACMLAQAEAATGRADWGGEEYFESDFRRLFAALVQSLEDEAQLHDAGHAGARRRLEELLSARLQFIDDRKRWPQIAAERIEHPIVVFGLPRAGSTFLHALLAQDPANRSPQTWEMMFPSPPPEQARYGDDSDPRIARCDATLRAQGLMSPQLLALHPRGARQPEECHYLMEFTTLSDNLTAGWRVPGFNRLRSGIDAITAYRMHRMVLQNLQFRCRAERWVLKNPGHLFHLERLLAVYPDAMLVQTHRDPAKVIPSVAALVLGMRRAASDDPLPAEKFAMGNLLAFAQGLEQASQFRRRPGLRQRFFDVHFTDLIREPLATVRSLYRHFGLDLEAKAESRMQDWLHGSASQNRPGRHTLAQYGLDSAMVDRHYRAYLETFGVQLER